MICQNCGGQIPDGSKFCELCGADTTRSAAGVQNNYYFSEISEASLPPKYRPLSPWAYFGYTLLFAIPLIGFICLIVFSLSDVNINRRNFARSYWCILVIALVAALICFVFLGVSLPFLAN